MFNSLRINEHVAAIAAGYRPEAVILKEAAEKLGKSVDEHKWSKAKSLAEKELGKKTGDQFYAYTMGIYKKMMGEEVVIEETKGVKEAEGDKAQTACAAAEDLPEEKKGGPAELAADLRVSIRIEKMGIGRYKRMLSKHALSPSDEKWLKRRIEELEACVKEMEDKLPELEKEGKGTDLKEAMIAEIKAVIAEVMTGKYRE